MDLIKFNLNNKLSNQVSNQLKIDTIIDNNNSKEVKFKKMTKIKVLFK